MSQNPQSQETHDTDSASRTGRWMLFVFWIAVLVFGSLWVQQILEQRHNPNQRVVSTEYADGLNEVVLTRNAQGHYVSNGLINGQPVVFFLDTGATGISIPAHIADNLGLSRGYPFQVSTANGLATAYSTELDSVSLGKITLHKLHGSINPNVDYDTVLLGMRFLKHLEFTQRGDQLTLREYE